MTIVLFGYFQLLFALLRAAKWLGIDEEDVGGCAEVGRSWSCQGGDKENHYNQLQSLPKPFINFNFLFRIQSDVRGNLGRACCISLIRPQI